MRKFHQGKFTPKHPEKYHGDPTNIIYRSSWEKRFMLYADSSKGIVQWNSEELTIPYLSPLDQRMHRYFPDFKIVLQDGRVFLIEIKPYAQCNKPRMNKNQVKYLNEAKIFMVNQAKWEAANLYCQQHGWKFMVLTERDLGIK